MDETAMCREMECDEGRGTWKYRCRDRIHPVGGWGRRKGREWGRRDNAWTRAPPRGFFGCPVRVGRTRVCIVQQTVILFTCLAVKVADRKSVV